jgi:hypothetical protein
MKLQLSKLYKREDLRHMMGELIKSGR